MMDLGDWAGSKNTGNTKSTNRQSGQNLLGAIDVGYVQTDFRSIDTWGPDSRRSFFSPQILL